VTPMGDSATFTVKLIDAVSGPARSASKALGGLRGALSSMAGGGDSVGKALGMPTGGGRGARGGRAPSAGRGFGEIAKAAKLAEGLRLDKDREAKRSTRQAFSGFGEIAKAARAAKSSGYDGNGNRKKQGGGKGAMLGDFVKGTLIAGGIEKAVGFAADLTKEIIAGAAELITFGQNSRLAFDQLAKHGATGEKLFEHARALAVAFGLDVEDTTHKYADFLKLQFDPKQADDLVRLGADMRGLGADATKLDSIFLALGQIKSLGKLQGGDLRQLEQAGVSGQLLYEELGKALGGKSNAEVAKLEQAGKISADVAIESLKSAIKRKLQEKDLGEYGAKFANNTISGITGRFKALSTDAAIKVTDKMTAPLTALAKKGLGKFETFLESPQGDATMSAIADALGKAAGFAADFVGAFGSSFGNTLGKIWDGIKPLFDALGGGGTGDAVGQTLKTIGKYMGEVAAAGVLVIGIAGTMGLGFEYLLATAAQVGIGIVGGLIDPLYKMIDDSLAWWFKLKGIWDEQGTSLTDKALGIGKQVVLGFVGGIESLLAYPGDAIAGMARGTIDALKGALGIASPSKATEAIGENVTGTYADTLNAGVSDARAGGAALGAAAVHGMNTTSSMYGPMVSTLASPPTLDTKQLPGRGGFSMPPAVFNIEVSGLSGDPEEAAQKLGSAVERKLDEYFRRLEMET
jgi:tape measure domain-containing protein